ncbi:glycosyltransferase [Paludibacter jiangxiensis]|uniref:Glycosyltransferase n=1 Tax=Paludibacter jiangxiensis TaxID=681398 RepID=A0A161LIP0_9BACT|nr:glycosyltransferase [Paludibacter jiangxiensis]GAT62306.1 glycosyltransferase [Paludibacter jiangxiensis]
MNTSKILVITGSYPPDVCGVGDYIANLTNSMSHQFEIFYSANWSLISTIKKIKEINRYKLDRLNIQYPTQGYKWSFVPLILAIYYHVFTTKTIILTLHEFSQRTWRAKLYSLFLIAFSSNIVVTNQYEKEYILKILPAKISKIVIIKIHSNIKASSFLRMYSDRSIHLTYFGQIRPNKGIEQFLECVKDLKWMDMNITITGQIVPEYVEYFKKIEQLAHRYQINLYTNQPEKEVIEILNSTKIVYLPFPDGASERRGSLLAALANGTCVISTSGLFVTNELYHTCIIIEPHQAHSIISSALNSFNNDSFLRIQNKNKAFLQHEMPSNWEEIALAYTKIKS